MQKQLSLDQKEQLILQLNDLYRKNIIKFNCNFDRNLHIKEYYQK